MSKASDRAAQAKSLRDDPAYNEICAEILNNAQALFMNSNAGIDDWTKANIMVKAVETFQNAIQARLADAKMEEKREARDRVND